MSVDVNLNGSYAGGLLATSANVPYFGWIDAVTNCTVSASSPSNPRIDTVVAWVDISALSSGVTNNVGAFKFTAVAGTAAASPVAPNSAAIQTAIGAGNPYLTLGNLAIATSAASVVNANITDTRVPSALAVPRLYGGSSNTLGHLVPNQADGTVVTTTDTGSVSTAMLADSGVTAAKLATSAITLGYAQITTNFTTASTSAVQATGLTVTVAVPAGGRKVKITVFSDTTYCTTAGGLVTMSVWDGVVGSGTLLSRTVTYAPTSNTGAPATAMAVVTPSAGSKTYNVGLSTSTGTGGIEALATAPAFILVEAI
ncbi:hypothetical protein [Pseudarthrobacter sp. W1I19]|uniref:hypothetical protein n=1 Tax=Pseudarthrobacter sp. W1I19 TaxID=3042288 RepID=UPI0027D78DCD|nr:hypothetical protein [Pseudarthrobacter sp. W1I19]